MVCLQFFRGEAKRTSILLHRSQHDLSVCLQFFRGEAKRHSILPHRSQHDLSVCLQFFRGVTKRHSILPHRSQHEIAVCTSILLHCAARVSRCRTHLKPSGTRMRIACLRLCRA